MFPIWSFQVSLSWVWVFREWGVWTSASFSWCSVISVTSGRCLLVLIVFNIHLVHSFLHKSGGSILASTAGSHCICVSLVVPVYTISNYFIRIALRLSSLDLDNLVCPWYGLGWTYWTFWNNILYLLYIDYRYYWVN